MVRFGIDRPERLEVVDADFLTELAAGDAAIVEVLGRAVRVAEEIAGRRWAHDGRARPRWSRRRWKRPGSRCLLRRAGGGRWPTRRARAVASGAPPSKLAELDAKARKKQLATSAWAAVPAR